VQSDVYPSQTISGAVRRGPRGDEVRLPGGTWVPCAINCYNTPRNATIDFLRRYDVFPAEGEQSLGGLDLLVSLLVQQVAHGDALQVSSSHSGGILGSRCKSRVNLVIQIEGTGPQRVTGMAHS
jgi:hypothetical protein